MAVVPGHWEVGQTCQLNLLGLAAVSPELTQGTPFSVPQLLNKGTEHYSYPCTPTTMLPRSAYWHHITGSQNIAEASSYGESLCLVPVEASWARVFGPGFKF